MEFLASKVSFSFKFSNKRCHSLAQVSSRMDDTVEHYCNNSFAVTKQWSTQMLIMHSEKARLHNTDHFN